MTDFCFLSLAFGDAYVRQQERLQNSLQAVHPSAEHFAWTWSYPSGSKGHRDSLYGFKVHAVRTALRKGYKKIIWLDTACILQQPVYYWFEQNLAIIAAKDDNALSRCIGTKALKYFGDPDIEGMHLVGGSVYVFDFNQPLCQTVFDQWAKAEEDGIFGSQFEQSSGLINRHRHDEACLAYLMYANGIEPMNCDEMKYNQGPDSVIIKKHFK